MLTLSVFYCSSSLVFSVSEAKLRSCSLPVCVPRLCGGSSPSRLLSLVINLLLPSFKFSALRKNMSLPESPRVLILGRSSRQWESEGSVFHTGCEASRQISVLLVQTGLERKSLSSGEWEINIRLFPGSCSCPCGAKGPFELLEDFRADLSGNRLENAPVHRGSIYKPICVHRFNFAGSLIYFSAEFNS